MANPNQQNQKISPLSAIFPKIELIGLIFAFIFIGLLGTFKINDPDTVQYMAAGKYIIEHGFSKTNIFSFVTTPGYPMHWSEWFFEIITYLAYLIGQWNALVILQIILILSIFFVVLKICQQQKTGYFYISILLFISSLIAAERFMLRADLFALLLLLVSLYILNKHQNENTKLIYFIPLIHLIWVNSHPSFPLSFVIITIFIIANLFKKELRQKTLQLIVILILCVLLSFLNPNGIGGLTWPFQMMIGDMKFLTQYNAEFQGPFQNQIFQSPKFAVNLYKYFVFFSSLLLLINIKRVRATHLLLYGFSLALSAQSVRHIALFSLISSTFLPHYLNESVNKINDWFNSIKNKRQKTYSEAPKQLIKLLSLLIMFFFMFKFGAEIINNDFYIKDQRSRRFGFGFSEIIYPEKAIQFIENNNIEGNGFNSYIIGTYLNWRLFPKKKNFIDGHTFSPETFNYYINIAKGDIPYSEAVEKYNLNYFLLAHTDTLNKNLTIKLYRDENWLPVYFDDFFIIFINKNNQTNKNIIEKYVIDFKNNINFNQEKLQSTIEKENFSTARSARGSFLVNIGLLDKAVYELEKAVQENNSNHIAHFNLGATYSRLGEFEKAIIEMQQAIRISPNYALAHYNLGNLYVQQKQFDNAILEYQKTLNINKKFPEAHYRLGVLYEVRGETQTAKNEYIKELKINPGFTPAQERLDVLIQKLL